MAVLFSMSGVLASSLAEGNSKRYVVSFKNSDTFEAVRKVAEGSSGFKSQGGSSWGKMSLFNTSANLAQTLNHIQMAVVEIKDPRDLQILKNHPAVQLIEEDVMYPPLPDVSGVWAATDEALATLRPIDIPWGVKAVRAPEAWAVTRGENVRVMVLDTGIDSEHVAIKDRFEKGRNFTTSDPENFYDDQGHGTHVAGTILADGRRGGLVGVAPQAKLLAGKVCAPDGCSKIDILEGINWAIEEKVQVVNMSLGGPWISPTELVAYARAEENDVMIVAASGNNGTGVVSYPAAVSTVLAVGALNPDLSRAPFSQYGPELDVVAPGVETLSSVPRGSGRAAEVKAQVNGVWSVVRSTAMVGSPVRSEPVMKSVEFVGLGKVEDFKERNVQGKIALIQRGEIAFADKVSHAIQAGASAVIIFNNEPGMLRGSVTTDGSEVAIPALMIEKSSGEALLQALQSGDVVMTAGVLPSDYDTYQGTSMATPHVAGVAALVRSANPLLRAEEVRSLLKQTAVSLEPNTDNQYGAGIVNAEKAAVEAEMAQTTSWASGQ